jgi:hypothetical protein
MANPTSTNQASITIGELYKDAQELYSWIKEKAAQVTSVSTIYNDLANPKIDPNTGNPDPAGGLTVLKDLGNLVRIKN